MGNVRYYILYLYLYQSIYTYIYFIFSYHDFYGVLVDKAEREIIVKNLGSNHVGFFFDTALYFFNDHSVVRHIHILAGHVFA